MFFSHRQARIEASSLRGISVCTPQILPTTCLSCDWMIAKSDFENLHFQSQRAIKSSKAGRRRTLPWISVLFNHEWNQWISGRWVLMWLAVRLKPLNLFSFDSQRRLMLLYSLFLSRSIERHIARCSWTSLLRNPPTVNLEWIVIRFCRG